MTQLVKGSVQDMAERSKIGTAEAMLEVEYVALVDTSGSMATRDSRDHQSRYDVAVQELSKLQGKYPGKVAVAAFSDSAAFCPNGVPINYGGGTDLAGGLEHIRKMDGLVKEIFCVSDGEPDNPDAALRAAKSFSTKISTIYVGPVGGYGEDFLKQLAAQSGGKSATADRVLELAATVERLMLGAGR